MALDADEESVLGRYTRAVCHLNFAVRKGRQLGFILGAGISNDLQIPPWKKLLSEMETRLTYKPLGSSIPESYRGEQLFQFFRKQRKEQLSFAPREIADAGINTDWRRVVSEILYEKYLNAEGRVDLDSFTAAIDKHPYLRTLARIAGNLDLVISHNFDNALEVAIATDSTNHRQANRRYNAFWKPDPFLRPGMLNIYHPNGFSPIEGLKGSDSIILTEANFADHLANTNNAEASFLLSHLSNKTWLLIGHSLADGTLKNALRLHANRRPGHVSYFIHWVEDGEESLPQDQRDAIREANFITYNLFTFFLSSKEIDALLRLISREEGDLHNEITSQDLVPRYVYYICGAVSSGKSTILSHLRSMATVEEWAARMPSSMNKLSVDASIDEKQEIDAKLEEAIWKKNDEVSEIKVGLVAVDRAPLDFIAFPDNADEKPAETARKRHNKVLRRLEQESFAKLCGGQIIVVQTDPQTLLERQIQRGRRPSDQDLKSGRDQNILKRQQELMAEIYKAAIDANSSVQGDCCSIATCVQDVIRIIYFNEYKPFNFKARLESYVGGVL